MCFEVKDTGIGISEDQAEHIFERFSQADAATTCHFGGTGLGLTISNILAERMGGQITLASEPGKGATFRLEIRLEPPKAAQNAPHAPTSSVVAEVQPATLILADDNQTNRLLINKYLQSTPLDIIEATNGREAVDLCRTHAPDIILMDMSMPEVDGIEATRQIRADADINQPIIIALTANAFESDRRACLDAGMNHFLQKPIRKALLLETIAKVQADQAETTEEAPARSIGS
jgi:hypothetical protein